MTDAWRDSRMRLLANHEDADYHEWYLTNERLSLDAIGRRNRGSSWGWWTWLVLECNNGDCPAKAIVRADVLTDMATERFPLPEPVRIPDAS